MPVKIKARKKPVNFKSRKFLKGLAKVKKECEVLHRLSEVDTSKLHETFK